MGDYYFNTDRSELDHELSAMCDTLLYTCHMPNGEGVCGRIDMHGEPLYEEVNGAFVMTGIICRQCWNRLLEEWLKRPAPNR